ncbi:RidA family protein [Pseudonocardia nigra]|uniref:RidA family protein n=1 Tax=Pseudonocardia nigra TaxID=1921578 RepID=UPI001C5FDBFB|nr:RidA family protein [Pseudonocardia nigra]
MPSDLPPPPRPQGDYVPAVLACGYVHSAGMTPRRDGVLQVRGTVGADLDVADAAGAAGLAAANALSAVAAAAGGLDRLARLVRMTVYVACAPGFTDLSAVADGASALLAHHVGTGALPARSAIGVHALPGGAPVEVELTAAVREDEVWRRR